LLVQGILSSLWLFSSPYLALCSKTGAGFTADGSNSKPCRIIKGCFRNFRL